MAVAAAGSVAEASAALEASAEAASAEAVPEARGKPVLFQPTRLTYRKDDNREGNKTSMEFVVFAIFLVE